MIFCPNEPVGKHKTTQGIAKVIVFSPQLDGKVIILNIPVKVTFIHQI